MEELERTDGNRLEDVLEMKLLYMERALQQVHDKLALKIDVLSDEIKKEVGAVQDHLNQLDNRVESNKENIGVLEEERRRVDRQRERQKERNNKIRRGFWWVVCAVVTASLFALGIVIVDKL